MPAWPVGGRLRLKGLGHDALPARGQVEGALVPVAARRVVGDHVVRLVEEAVAVVDLGGGEGEGSGLVTDHVKGKLTLNHVDRLVDNGAGWAL